VLIFFQAITLGLHANKNRVVQEPSYAWIEAVQGSFAAPPTTIAELKTFIAGKKKELNPASIIRDREIGSSVVNISPQFILVKETASLELSTAARSRESMEQREFVPSNSSRRAQTTQARSSFSRFEKNGRLFFGLNVF
jgi:hypothetical protein